MAKLPKLRTWVRFPSPAPKLSLIQLPLRRQVIGKAVQNNGFRKPVAPSGPRRNGTQFCPIFFAGLRRRERLLEHGPAQVLGVAVSIAPRQKSRDTPDSPYPASPRSRREPQGFPNPLPSWKLLPIHALGTSLVAVGWLRIDNYPLVQRHQWSLLDGQSTIVPEPSGFSSVQVVFAVSTPRLTTTL